MTKELEIITLKNLKLMRSLLVLIHDKPPYCTVLAEKAFERLENAYQDQPITKRLAGKVPTFGILYLTAEKL